MARKVEGPKLAVASPQSEPVSISTCRAFGAHIDPNLLGRGLRRHRGDYRPSPALEQRQQRRRGEPRSRRIDMAVAIRGLAMGIETLGRYQMQIVLGSRHSNIERPSLSSVFAVSPVARSDGMQPSMTFRMKTDLYSWPLTEWVGRQDQVVLVEQRHAGLITGCVRRVEGEFGEKAFTGGVAGRDLLEFDDSVLAETLHHRVCCQADVALVQRILRR